MEVEIYKLFDFAEKSAKLFPKISKAISVIRLPFCLPVTLAV
jgi:hypothetical protein